MRRTRSAAIGGRRVQVVARVEFARRKRRARRRGRSPAAAVRAPPAGRQRRRPRAALIFGIRHRGAGHDGEIAVPPRELAERVAFAGAGGRETARPRSARHRARGRHQAGEELSAATRALLLVATKVRPRRRARAAPAAFRRSDRHARPSRRPCRGARLPVPDPGQRLREQRLARGEFRATPAARPAARAAPTRIALPSTRDAAQLRDAHDVDQHLRPRHAHREQRHRASARRRCTRGVAASRRQARHAPRRALSART